VSLTPNDLESQALRLPPEERVRLAERLLASVRTDASVDEDWLAESLRRLGDLEQKVTTGIPVEAVIERARSLIR